MAVQAAVGVQHSKKAVYQPVHHVVRATAARLGVGEGVLSGAVAQLGQHVAHRERLGFSFDLLVERLHALREFVGGWGPKHVPDTNGAAGRDCFRGRRAAGGRTRQGHVVWR